MKKILVILGVLLVCNCAYADMLEVFNYSDMNMKNFWEQNGKYEQKVLDVGTKIINSNNLNKRIVIRLVNNTKTINAYASFTQKSVNIYSGILPYFENDDELAAVMAHEMGHCLDFYEGGFSRWLITMQVNKKEYEYKADLVGIDLMVKAGYNPIAYITMSNKALDESFWDDFFFWSHPKGSKRALAAYKYIYTKYPWALNSDMIHNVNYQNFVHYSQKDINKFIHKEKLKAIKRGENI